MKLIDPSIEIMTPLNGVEIAKHIEKAIRNCYKSEDLTTDESYKVLIKKILDSHHYSTIEHFSITVRVICSRACMSQWTRHRLMSFSIESQRFINYSRNKFGSEITFIKPVEYESWSDTQKLLFDDGLVESESRYMELIKAGLKAQDARNLLPNACKTEMVVTGNLRVWRDFLLKRTEKAAQGEIRFLANEILNQFKQEIPVIFED